VARTPLCARRLTVPPFRSPISAPQSSSQPFGLCCAARRCAATAAHQCLPRDVPCAPTSRAPDRLSRRCGAPRGCTSSRSPGRPSLFSPSVTDNTPPCKGSGAIGTRSRGVWYVLTLLHATACPLARWPLHTASLPVRSSVGRFGAKSDSPAPQRRAVRPRAPAPPLRLQCECTSSVLSPGRCGTHHTTACSRRT
jgi:hypothetical protein